MNNSLALLRKGVRVPRTPSFFRSLLASSFSAEACLVSRFWFHSSPKYQLNVSDGAMVSFLEGEHLKNSNNNNNNRKCC